MVSSMQRHSPCCPSLPEPLSGHLFMDDPALTVLRAGWLVRSLLDIGESLPSVRRRRKNAFSLPDTEEEDISTALMAVGLGEPAGKHLTPGQLRAHLRRVLGKLESSAPAPGPVYRAAEAIAELIGLDTLELQLLLLLCFLEEDPVLGDQADRLGELSIYRATGVLADWLGYPREAVAAALSQRGVLAMSGLVRFERHFGHQYLRRRLNVLDGLSMLLLTQPVEPDQLFTRYLRPAAAGRLQPPDFNHLGPDYGYLQQLLKHAAARQARGVNVLIYGPPGTGKTELVKTLAAELELRLFEVNTEDYEGAPVSGQRRLDAYRLAQHLLRRRPGSLVLFDEIEDVFEGLERGLHKRLSQMSLNKGWLNQLLETNPVPSVWVSNQVWHIDKAFLRRFDFVLLLDTPPREVRQRLLHQYLAGLDVSPAWLERMAELEQLAPAHIERAARVTQLIGPTDTAAREHCLERVISGSLEVMGLPTQPTAPAKVAGYDLAVVNASVDLTRLSEGLSRTGTGRLCLYGPPGTGKSAYAAWLAERLQRPLLRKQASDLLNCFLGGTEANIAAMFREAERLQAVLLLDEADSFLQDRQGAQRSWEITQVNELLVQMEAFEGIFLCATNLMDRLDPAVLRRFDVKIRLDYLRPEQAAQLFQHTLQEAGQPSVVPAALAALANLTPGDFATVVRKARVLGLPLTADWLLTTLTEECHAKPGAPRQIGFVV